MKNISLLFS